MTSNKRSIELHFKHGIRSNFKRLFIQFSSMATSGGTPKKFYKSISVSTVISRCRLCYSVGDPKHCKNLFGDSNRAILRSAESFYGSELPQSSDLPHLICRPCERRLNTVIQFKQTIGETQRKVREGVRAKRCVDLSPSVTKPAPKARATGNSRRRSLDFAGGESESAREIVSPILLSLHLV